MTFISKEEVKQVRNNLKRTFPTNQGWKFSVTGGNTSKLNVHVMQYPSIYSFGDYVQVNHYYLDEDSFAHSNYSVEELKILRDIRDICLANHWDDSDTMTDYFSCAFYFHLGIGKWDKPAIAR